MPKRKKKNLIKHKDSKKSIVKPKSNISKEVMEIFFNTKDEEKEEIEAPLDILDDEINIDDALVPPPDLLDQDVEVPETVSIVNDSTEDSEHLMVVSSFSDDGESIQTIQSIKKNTPPVDTWADKDTKFKCGQRIMPSTLSKSACKNYECAVIISAGAHQNTYMIKLSRSMNEICVNGSNWVEASKDCKPYVSYWESISPTMKVIK